MMSAVRKTSARLGRIFAPLPANSASVYPASTPAPLSTTASRPSFAKVGSTAGTNETRRSPGKLSRGTPTIMQQPPTLLQTPQNIHNAAIAVSLFYGWGCGCYPAGYAGPGHFCAGNGARSAAGTLAPTAGSAAGGQ